MDQDPRDPQLQALRERVEALERELQALKRAAAEATAVKQRLETRRPLENLPLAALIILLGCLAAHWVYTALWG